MHKAKLMQKGSSSSDGGQPTCESQGVMSWSSRSFAQAAWRRTFTLGMMRLTTCLPVHKGSGLRMAGMGTRPSQSSSHIRMFMNKSFLMKLSRLVIRRQPSRVSCTMPMTGLLAYVHKLDLIAMLKAMLKQ